MGSNSDLSQARSADVKAELLEKAAEKRIRKNAIRSVNKVRGAYGK
jgi:hypothetical protein